MGARVRLLLDDMLDQWRALDACIKKLDDEFPEMARNDPAARRLATIPGIGVINATALVAAIGDGRTFSRGRDLPAWLGLVPRQATTGGKPKLLGVPSAAASACAKWSIQGARAALHQPTAENGTRYRPLYEYWDARISILAKFKPMTGYVDADCSDRIAETACRRGGPYGSGRTLLVYPHDRGVDRLDVAVVNLCDRAHQPIPDASFPPAVEAIIDRRRWAVANRHIRPGRTRPKHPEDAVQNPARSWHWGFSPSMKRSFANSPASQRVQPGGASGQIFETQTGRGAEITPAQERAALRQDG